MRLAHLSLLILAPLAIADAAPTAKPAADPNKKICVTEEVTGSRLNTKRTCLTPSEWDKYRRELRDTIERSQKFSQQCQYAGGC